MPAARRRPALPAAGPVWTSPPAVMPVMTALVLLIGGRRCRHRRPGAGGGASPPRPAAAWVAPPEQEGRHADRDAADERAHAARVVLAGGDLACAVDGEAHREHVDRAGQEVP